MMRLPRIGCLDFLQAPSFNIKNLVLNPCDSPPPPKKINKYGNGSFWENGKNPLLLRGLQPLPELLLEGDLRPDVDAFSQRYQLISSPTPVYM